MDERNGKKKMPVFTSGVETESFASDTHDLDMERALLGSLLLNADLFREVEETLREIHTFYAPRHQMIFEVMLELSAKGAGIDAVSVQSRIADRGNLDLIGGNEYIAELIENAPSVANVKNYATVIREKYIRRQLQSAATNIANLSRQTKEEIDIIMEKAEQELFHITQKHTQIGHKDLEVMIPEIVEEIILVSENQGATRGISSGYDSIDRALSGFHKSDLIILAARPSVGKTTLALDIARRAALRERVKVGLMSLEMSAAQLIERLLAAESSLDAWNMRTGKMKSAEHFRTLNEAAEKLRQLPIYIDDRSSMSTLNIRSSARKMKYEKQIDLLIVDYLQLITPHESRRSESLVHHVTEISRTLKQVARELEIPVIALSQLSREVEKRAGKPRLSDLRDSGSIEQDADVVMFLHRDQSKMYEGDDASKPYPVELLIEKHRNGPTGKVNLMLDRKHSTFVEAAHDEYAHMPEANENVATQ